MISGICTSACLLGHSTDNQLAPSRSLPIKAYTDFQTCVSTGMSYTHQSLFWSRSEWLTKTLRLRSALFSKKKKDEEKEKPASFLKDYGPEFEYNNLRGFFKYLFSKFPYFFLPSLQYPLISCSLD